MKFSSSRIETDDLLQVGTIVGPHGIKGTVKVYANADLEACFAPKNEIILIDTNGYPGRSRIVSVQPNKNILRLTLKGVGTRDEAQALTGCAVYIPKADLPVLEEDTFYWTDLIGMSVYTQGDVLLGTLEGIIPTGANDVYVVKTTGGYEVPEVLIPAIASVVLTIDVEKQSMIVALPDGLMAS